METQAKKLILSIFENIMQSSSLDIIEVEKYISPDYVQFVDGVELNYSGFVEHIKKQKEVIQSLSVDFLSMAEEGDTIFTNHVVTATKKDGSIIRVKVIAQFTIHDNRLVRCDELTHLLSGSHEDRDIGSRH